MKDSLRQEMEHVDSQLGQVDLSCLPSATWKEPLEGCILRRDTPSSADIWRGRINRSVRQVQPRRWPFQERIRKAKNDRLVGGTGHCVSREPPSGGTNSHSRRQAVSVWYWRLRREAKLSYWFLYYAQKRATDNLASIISQTRVS